MKPRNPYGVNEGRIPPDGTLRQSQVVTTFGPGAMIDLVDHAVIVCGTEKWRFGGNRKYFSEARLRDTINERRDKALPRLSLEQPFVAPPQGDDQSPSIACGIPVKEFPTWMVCKGCSALIRASQLNADSSGRRFHNCSDGKTLCVPVRFVLACKHGHIQDFPWALFAHPKGEQCSRVALRLDEGPTGDLSQIFVRCAGCGSGQALSGAYSDGFMIQCLGERPWLSGPEAKVDCKLKTPKDVRAMARTASNSYFSQVFSSLTIPEQTDEIAELVQKHWEDLEFAESVSDLERELRKDKFEPLRRFPKEQILEKIASQRRNEKIERKPTRTAEFEQLMASPVDKGEVPQADSNYFARKLKTKSLPYGISQVVLCKVLREIRAQVGFTRLEAPNADLQGEFDIGVETAEIGLGTNWLPASEIKGEGLFISLDEKLVQAWEDSPAVKKRREQLFHGFQSWSKEVEKDKPLIFPDVRYYLLHSLSHLLMSAISLDCGYSASAIHERIYCAGRDQPTPMAAILLSTGTSGTEGSLGGLVEQAKYIQDHLRRAFDLGILCSNDPVCASHSPHNDPAEQYRAGAACHGCLYVAEVSCERFNQYLDRALVVPTIGNGAELAFFRSRP